MADELLSKEDMERVLQNCFGTRQIIYESSEMKPLSDNVEGLLGEHFKLKITYTLNGEKDVGYFFVKTKPTKTQMQRDLCEKFHAYEKEILFYNTICKEFHKRKYDTSFAPKCYLCKDSKTLVMEDLYETGYTLSTKTVLYDLSKCESLLEALAQFHSSGFLLEQEKSIETGRRYRLDDEYGDFFNEIMFDGNEFMVNSYNSKIDLICHIIDDLSESKDYKEEFKAKLKEMDHLKLFNGIKNYRRTLGHGDLWSNNMLFKVKDGITTKCCVLDYQLLRYYHPGYDVMCAIFENTDSTFRKKYLSYLKHYYYANLSSIFRSKCLPLDDVLPLEDYMEGIKEIEYVVRLHAIFAHSYTYLPPTFFKDAVNSDDNTLDDTMNGSDNEPFIDAYRTFPPFRQMMIDDIYDLRNYLITEK